MRLHQIVGTSSVDKLIRYRLENNTYHSVESACECLQKQFPHHIVDAREGELAVQVKDKSFSIAVFRTVF